MEKYHGKLLYFKSSLSKEEVQKFLTALPKRNDFIPRSAAKVVYNDIQDKKPIYFMPNSVVDQHFKDGNKLVYKLLLIGITRDGSKAAVVVDGITPFFDIRVPEGMDASTFAERMMGLWKEQQIYTARWEIIRKLPFKYFYEDKVDYVRFYFNTLHARTKAIKNSRETKFEYMAQIGSVLTKDGKMRDTIKEQKVFLETASDDKSCYYRKASREYKFKLCDWNEVSGYTLLGSDNEYTKSNCVRYTLQTDVNNLVSIRNTKKLGTRALSDKDLQQAKNKDLLKDKSMLMDWDLETFAPHATGNAPLPENVFDSSGNEEDVVFLHSASFHWYYTTDILVKVAISEMPVPARPDCLIIQVEKQTDIIKVKSLLMERMAPEFVTGFNDGIYDWPFLLRRAEQFDDKKGTALIEFMKKHMSAIPYTPNNAKYSIPGAKTEHIKVEADTYVDNEYFDIPGFICMDTRTIFRQLYPTAEKTSLNFFLAANKLGSKEDMPYQTMFKIYRLLRELRRTFNTPKFEELVEGVKAWQAEFGELHVPFKHLSLTAGNNPADKNIKKFDNTSYNIDRLTIKDIMVLLEQATQVVHYCNIDAQRCQELLKIRNIIPDRREVANLSYTSMFDAFYRAGGMKVRNLVISQGIEPEWDLVFTNIAKETKDTRKYPGAYVLTPKKGLYRDTLFQKRRRRATYCEATGKKSRHAVEEVTPGKPEFNKELLKPNFDLDYPPTNVKNNDESNEHDRPCSGLDFSSLYPSLIMTYNLSPEKVIVDPAIKAMLEKKIDRYGLPYKILEVDFLYGHADEPAEKKERIHGWVIQHHPVVREVPDAADPAKKIKETQYLGMGLYPYILKMLYDDRTALKAKMEYYAGPKEFMEKIFEKRQKAKLPDIRTIPVEEQKEYVQLCLDEELKVRQTNYDKTKKDFYKFQLHGFKEVIEFFEHHFLHPKPGENGEFEEHTTNVRKLYEEIDFQFNYYNCKQNALKVFMNTFYGETGNSQSPFFLIHVAGAITTNGQKNIKYVKAFCEKNGWRVLYGDTDSLYICAPEKYFTELDGQYARGEIDRLTYWTRMIEITMETLDKFKKEVNDYLFADNGTRFLKMAYEEVLWPFAMVGKKKYIGVKHVGIVNLSICMPECSLTDFMKSKLLFIRGLELKKRGSSEFLKLVCFEIVKECFCITSTKTMKEIVEDKLQDVATRKWNPELFIKSARYKLPGKNLETGKPKPGNVTVLRFVTRMNEVEEKDPSMGVRGPEIGERFPYIVTKKYPWTYDLRGRKVNIKVGDKYEYADALKNEKYKEYVISRGGSLDIDMDYYIMNEVIGQFARFILYHPDYDHFFEEIQAAATTAQREAGDDTVIDQDDLYKKADTKAHNYAKKTLRDLYKQNFAVKYEVNPVYKQIFQQTNKLVNRGLTHIYGDAFAIFDITNTLVTSADTQNQRKKSKPATSDTVDDALETEDPDALLADDEPGMISFTDVHMRKRIKETIVEKAKKVAIKEATVYIKDIIENLKINPYRLYNRYVAGPSSLCKIRRKIYQQEVNNVTKELDACIPEFQKVCAENVTILMSLIDKIKRDNNLQDPSNVPKDPNVQNMSLVSEDDLMELLQEKYGGSDDPDEDAESRELREARENMIVQMYDLFIRMIVAYRNLHEVEAIEQEINYYKSLAVKAPTVPPSIKKEMQLVKRGKAQDEFAEWIKKKNGYTHNTGV